MAPSKDRPSNEASPAPDSDHRELAGDHRTPSRREADDWALVLASEGLSPSVVREGPGFAITVDAIDAESAARTLATWRSEEAAHRARSGHPDLPRPDDSNETGDVADATGAIPDEPEATRLDLAAAYASALTLVAYHAGLVTSGRHGAALEQGGSRASRVLDGEIWRTLTALTLHADVPHVTGNALFGGLFLGALTGRLGLGCATLAFVLTGSIGNLANALYYGSGHGSVGASTGVFGLLGVLVGFAARRRHAAHPPRRGAWMPIAAGLALVGLLGGPRPEVDFSAHLFGLATGTVAGILLSIPLARRPRPGRAAQWLAGLTALALISCAWRLA